MILFKFDIIQALKEKNKDIYNIINLDDIKSIKECLYNNKSLEVSTAALDLLCKELETPLYDLIIYKPDGAGPGSYQE